MYQVDVPVYTAGTNVKPSETVKQGLEEDKKKKIELMLLLILQLILYEIGVMFNAAGIARGCGWQHFLLILTLQHRYSHHCNKIHADLFNQVRM